MSFFSELDLARDFAGNRPDNSFPTPVMVLKDRIVSLKERLIELKKYESGEIYPRIPKGELSGVLPEHIFNLSEVIYAIELAEIRLAEEELE